MNLDMQPHPDAEKIATTIEELLPEMDGKRARDVAAAMGIAEGLLLSARVGKDVTRLKPASKQMLKAFIDLGEVMVLTRNESCVHEKIGHFGRIGGGDAVAIVLNKEVDLRVFLNHWIHVFAVEEETAKGVKRSIQIFDAGGQAVHKIYLRPASNLDGFEKLKSDFVHDTQLSLFQTKQSEKQEAFPPRADSTVDVASLRKDWSGMTDVHQFFGLLKKHKLDRQQALRLAGNAFASKLDTGSVRAALTAAADMQLPIMVFVHNRGCVQIHTGPIAQLKTVGPWFNILDPGFNLHLREDHIHAVWLVRKPNSFGHVTSVEVYDGHGDMIVQFYGVRDEKEDENPQWRALAEQLPKIEATSELITETA
nr:ChuX/HutX family heme-like substrate-binding protein [uncultured Cohaesibacter sp.]